MSRSRCDCIDYPTVGTAAKVIPHTNGKRGTTLVVNRVPTNAKNIIVKIRERCPILGNDSIHTDITECSTSNGETIAARD